MSETQNVATEQNSLSNDLLSASTFKLSVCKRKNKVLVGVFRDFDLIRDFVEYDDEVTGVQTSRVWLMDNYCVTNPEIVYPKVTKMVCR